MILDSRDTDFGGLSAIMMQNSGANALVLSDSGDLFSLEIVRTEDGTISRAIVTRQKPLYLFDDTISIDTEGLAQGPQGSIFVSFEDPLQVAIYTPDRNWPQEVLEFPKLDQPNINRGLEALAIDNVGRLVTLPEAIPDGRETFPIFGFEDGIWTEIAQLQPEGSFLVVGADIGPNGRLYVLERAVSLLGFRSRIRRIDLSQTDAPVETLFTSHVAQLDNHEGISVWQDATGTTRVTLVSDDNFLSVQKSELVEFVLIE